MALLHGPYKCFRKSSSKLKILLTKKKMCCNADEGTCVCSLFKVDYRNVENSYACVVSWLCEVPIDGSKRG